MRIYGLAKIFGLGTNKEDPLKLTPKQKIEFVPRTKLLTRNGSYLETLTEQELLILKVAMIEARRNYTTAIELIARNNTKNPYHIATQQGILEEILWSYVRGDGLSILADEMQETPELLREFLEPLGFTEEEFPLEDRDDIDWI
jgi:hypothetical protein